MYLRALCKLKLRAMILANRSETLTTSPGAVCRENICIFAWKFTPLETPKPKPFHKVQDENLWACSRASTQGYASLVVWGVSRFSGCSKKSVWSMLTRLGQDLQFCGAYPPAEEGEFLAAREMIYSENKNTGIHPRPILGHDIKVQSDHEQL